MNFDFDDPTRAIRIPPWAYVKALARIIARRLLPLKWSMMISLCATRIRLALAPRRRVQMERFLKPFLPVDWSRREIGRTIRLSVAIKRIGGRTYAPVWRRSREWLLRTFRPEGLEHLDAARRAGGGAIVLATGTGLKSWTNPILRQLGCPLRPIQRLRVGSQALMLMRWDGVVPEALPYPDELGSATHMKRLHDLVRRGEWIMHVGQDGGHAKPLRGRLLDFDVESGRGPWLIARLTGAPLIPAVVLMYADSTFKLIVGSPICVSGGTSPADAMQSAFQCYLDFISRHVLPVPWNFTRPSYWENLALARQISHPRARLSRQEDG